MTQCSDTKGKNREQDWDTSMSLAKEWMDQRQKDNDQVLEGKEETRKRSRRNYQQRVRVKLITVGEVQVAKVRRVKRYKVAWSEKRQFQGKPK